MDEKTHAAEEDNTEPGVDKGLCRREGRKLPMRLAHCPKCSTRWKRSGMAQVSAKATKTFQERLAMHTEFLMLMHQEGLKNAVIMQAMAYPLLKRADGDFDADGDLDADEEVDAERKGPSSFNGEVV